MFYRTQIHSVTDFGAVDVAGKKLRFMGYLPIKAGDWVFTDGTYIFGNVPPRGSPATFGDDPPGVPVLGDFDSQNNELRGYFTTNGIYKRFGIVKDDWIVNSDIKFAHGSNISKDDEKIIDAEFAENGDNKVNKNSLLVATKKIFQLANDDEDYHWGQYYSFNSIPVARVQFEQDDFTSILTASFANHYVQHSTNFPENCSYEKGYVASPSVQYDGTHAYIPIHKCNFIMRGSTLDYRMHDDNIIKNAQILIRSDSRDFACVDIADLLKDFESLAKNEVEVLPSRQSVKHIKSRAFIDNFKLFPDASWVLLLQVEIFASNTFFLESYDVDFDFDPPKFEYGLFDCKSTVSHNFFLLKINSEGISEKVFNWHCLYPVNWGDSAFGDYFYADTEEEGFDTGFSVQYTSFGRIETTPAVARWSNPLLFFTNISTYYESALLRPDLNYTGSNPQVDFIDPFFFPIQENFNAQFSFHSFEEFNPYTFRDYFSIRPRWKLSGIFDGDDKKFSADFDLLNAHKSNMSFTELKDKSFLFGVRKDEEREISGVLYKIDSDGNPQQVGYGLKNFRLRELRKINKAKH